MKAIRHLTDEEVSLIKSAISHTKILVESPNDNAKDLATIEKLQRKLQTNVRLEGSLLSQGFAL